LAQAYFHNLSRLTGISVDHAPAAEIQAEMLNPALDSKGQHVALGRFPIVTFENSIQPSEQSRFVDMPGIADNSRLDFARLGPSAVSCDARQQAPTVRSDAL
jgi:hypothetical protein